jgi:hypothetical protein
MTRTLTHIIALFLVTCMTTVISGSEYAEATSGQYTKSTHNPFEKYQRVTDNVYVYDHSQFSKYTGPVQALSKSDIDNGIEDKRRLGTVTIARGMKATLDIITDPMSEHYELRDEATGLLIHHFSYYATAAAPILFNGSGVIYQYALIDGLCDGPVTRKFEFAAGKLTETPQAIIWINTETELLKDVKLYSKPIKTAPVIASLNKGTKVLVITHEKPDRFLIKTPLGLVGWLINQVSDSSVMMTQCN